MVLEMMTFVKFFRMTTTFLLPLFPIGAHQKIPSRGNQIHQKRVSILLLDFDVENGTGMGEQQNIRR
jgi:hypothetical protein